MIYTVSKIFITALIYDDYSGLSDGDHMMLEDFLSDVVSVGYWVVEETETHENFKRCDITASFSDCINIKLIEE